MALTHAQMSRIANTAMGEGRGESDQAIAAIVSSILNRADATGKDPAAIASNIKTYNGAHYKASPAELAKAMQIIQGVQDGSIPRSKATHFWNPATAKKQSWMPKVTDQQKIGKQIFGGIPGEFGYGNAGKRGPERAGTLNPNDQAVYSYNAGKPYSKNPQLMAAVSDLQSQLAGLGYYTGKVDGKYGPLTKAAVQGFQTDQGIGVDGKAGPDTRNALAIGGQADIDSAGYSSQPPTTQAQTSAGSKIAFSGNMVGAPAPQKAASSIPSGAEMSASMRPAPNTPVASLDPFGTRDSNKDQSRIAQSDVAFTPPAPAPVSKANQTVGLADRFASDFTQKDSIDSLQNALGTKIAGLSAADPNVALGIITPNIAPAPKTPAPAQQNGADLEATLSAARAQTDANQLGYEATQGLQDRKSEAQASVDSQVKSEGFVPGSLSPMALSNVAGATRQGKQMSDAVTAALGPMMSAGGYVPAAGGGFVPATMGPPPGLGGGGGIGSAFGGMGAPPSSGYGGPGSPAVGGGGGAYGGVGGGAFGPTSLGGGFAPSAPSAPSTSGSGFGYSPAGSFGGPTGGMGSSTPGSGPSAPGTTGGGSGSGYTSSPSGYGYAPTSYGGPTSLGGGFSTSTPTGGFGVGIGSA